MTPAEHYAEAERWLRLADEHAQATPLGDRVRTPAAVAVFDSFVHRAQVHATLATASPSVEHVRCGCGHILTQHGIDRGRCIQPTCTCPAYEEAGEW